MISTFMLPMVKTSAGVRTANLSITHKRGRVSGSIRNLKEFYRQAEKYGQGGVKQPESGRFRFYGVVDAADKAGVMAGRRVVREWDPASGATRTGHETVDQAGRVRVVRPQLDGPKVHHMFDAEGNYVGPF